MRQKPTHKMTSRDCGSLTSRVLGRKLPAVAIVGLFLAAAPAPTASASHFLRSGPSPATKSLDVPLQSSDYPHEDITSGGPLTTIGVGTDLSCQVAYSGDDDYEFYNPEFDPADCGTFVSIDGQLYAPDFANHQDSATSALGSYTPFTPI